MLEDFYDELQPSGRFETVARLAKRAVNYYDGLPPSLRTPETQRHRAMAQARLAWVEVQQGDLKPAFAAAEEAGSCLQQMRRHGDESEGTAYALALGVQTEGFYYMVSTDTRAMAIPLERGAEILRPFARSPKASRRMQLAYADMLNWLSHSQSAEQSIATCEEALRLLATLGALDASDLDAASAWGDTADSQARAMLAAGRLDDAERLERQVMNLAEKVVERRPNDLRARKNLFFVPDMLSMIEAMRFHDAAALEWAREKRKAGLEFTRFNPTDRIGWQTVSSAENNISALLFRGGSVTQALAVARSGAEVETSHKIGATFTGGTWNLVAMQEAQLGDRPAAEAALQQARDSMENYANGLGMPEHTRNLWSLAIRDAERQTRWAFGEDAVVLESARNDLIRIEKLGKGEDNSDIVAVLNQWKRRALSDAGRAALNLGQFANAETAGRVLLSLPVLHTEMVEGILAPEPDDLGWARVIIAQVQVWQGKLAEAQQTLEPALTLYRDMQTQGITHVTFRQRFARALYLQSLAEPSDAGGLARRREELNEAERLLQNLTDEARQLHDSKELLSWITAARKKLNPDAETKQP